MASKIVKSSKYNHATIYHSHKELTKQASVEIAFPKHQTFSLILNFISIIYDSKTTNSLSSFTGFN